MPVWRSWPSERPLPVKVPPLPSRRGASPWPGRGAFRRGRGRPGGSGNRSERAFTTPHRTILPADMGLRPRRATIHPGHVALVGPAPARFQPRERTNHARYRPGGRRGSPPGPDRENRCARADPPPPPSPVVAAHEGRRTSCSSCSTTWAAVRPRSSAAGRSFWTRAGPSAAIRSSLAAASARPEGPQTLVMDFAHGGGMGRGRVATVRVGGAVHATGRVAITTPLRFSPQDMLAFG